MILQADKHGARACILFECLPGKSPFGRGLPDAYAESRDTTGAFIRAKRIAYTGRMQKESRPLRREIG